MSGKLGEPLLEVQDLRSHYELRMGTVKAVDGISFSISKAETLGIIGESGSGKSTVGWSIMRYLPPPGRIVGGRILFEGKDIVQLGADEMRQIRWRKIAMVTQTAMEAFDPLMRIGDQITETILQHEQLSKDTALRMAEKLFEDVGLHPSRLTSYPHELSGGMKQRAMIAMALACMPGLVIADEPTTALDVIVQAQILRLFKDLRDKIRSMSMLYISHDISVVVDLCDKVLVMYAGKAAEWGETRAILTSPLHPYTRLLVASTPNINRQEMQFVSIPGSPPDMLRLPEGCVFHPRCPYAWELCRAQEPQFLEAERNHFAACHLATPKGDLMREK